MYEELISFIRNIYKTNGFIPLHAPYLRGNEKKYLSSVVDTNFVSSVGKLVSNFENAIKQYTGSKYAIATVNGTSGLHICLKISGAQENTEVITQSLTFIATCNAIRYCGATPIFIDVDKNTLGLSPEALENFLEENCELRDDGICWNIFTKKKIVACVPMHTFGFPTDCHQIKKICKKYNLQLIEDSAESLGSSFNGKHTGTVGDMGVLSFNGNKIITTGGGGMILTNSKRKANLARHLTTQAKIKSQWEFIHDQIGYNYRMPNLNAALGLAQIEKIEFILKRKREIAELYYSWGQKNGFNFFKETKNTQSNYWLNTMILKNRKEKKKLLTELNNKEIMSRPAWKPMHKLNINKDVYKTNLSNTNFLYDRIVNVPSSVPKPNN